MTRYEPGWGVQKKIIIYHQYTVEQSTHLRVLGTECLILIQHPTFIYFHIISYFSWFHQTTKAPLTKPWPVRSSHMPGDRPHANVEQSLEMPHRKDRAVHHGAVGTIMERWDDCWLQDDSSQNVTSCDILAILCPKFYLMSAPRASRIAAITMGGWRPELKLWPSQSSHHYDH